MQITQMSGMGLVANRERTSSALAKTSRALEKVLERLSTAQRINRASDDAAGLGVSEILRTQIRGFKMASNNVADASSALNIAEGASNEVSSMLQRQRELALQSKNDTLTNPQRSALNIEYQQLNAEISRTANVTQFNSQPVANGTGLGSGTAQIQAGPNAGDQLALPAMNMTAANLGVGGTSIDTRANADLALSAIDTSLDKLNTQRSTVGAYTNRFESIDNNLRVAQINTQAAESVLRDQDMAMGLAELVRSQIMLQAGTSTFARFNEISSNHVMGLMS